MLGLDTLDVAIGLVFLYLLMSLVCSAAIEVIEAFLQYRARDLEQGIRELLRDPKLVEELYTHPLVTTLYKGDYTPPANGKFGRFEKWRPSKWKLPSYIPSRTFALAVSDLLLGKQVLQGAVPPAGQQTASKLNVASFLSPTKYAKAEKAYEAVVKLVAAANNDAAKARENIEEWFNSSMDRVSGWYKRRTQMFLLVVGFGASLFFNVDSISITKDLWTNKDRRTALVNAATEYAKTTTAPVTDTAGKPAAPTPEQMKAAQKQLDERIDKLKSAGIPLGWSGFEFPSNPRTWPWWKAWLAKIAGILITACAVSLGAPFWFDTLNKIIVVRSTVKPKEKSGTEGPKEPQASKS
jgi:hypothetical protein